MNITTLLTRKFIENFNPSDIKASLVTKTIPNKTSGAYLFHHFTRIACLKTIP